jgi:hypothetical protein
MKNLYRFKEYISEANSIGDFAKDLAKNLGNSFKEIEESSSKISQFKEFPLGLEDDRKIWVKKIQDFFVSLKYQKKPKDEEYGVFNSATESAVKEYQKSKKKVETGKVDDVLMELISGEIKSKDTEALKDTPFKDKEEGNKFREWIHKKDEKYANEIGLKKDSDQYNNEIIKKAWKKYGEEYQKEEKK